MENPDYLIIGTGLSALSFGALMSKSGKRVKFIEAHEYPGGYGHTFPQGEKYRFNAQLHYVWNCGEGQPTPLRILTAEYEAETGQVSTPCSKRNKGSMSGVLRLRECVRKPESANISVYFPC